MDRKIFSFVHMKRLHNRDNEAVIDSYDDVDFVNASLQYQP
jgi:hypothetical protein